MLRPQGGTPHPIFTPATAAAGHGGSSRHRLGLDEVRLETGLGLVPLRLERSEGRVVFGWMEQPVAPFRSYERADELLAALGVEQSLLPVEAYENGPLDVFVRLEERGGGGRC